MFALSAGRACPLAVDRLLINPNPNSLYMRRLPGPFSYPKLLLAAARDAGTPSSAPQHPRNRDEAEARAARSLHLVRLGELSAASRALTRGGVA